MSLLLSVYAFVSSFFVSSSSNVQYSDESQTEVSRAAGSIWAAIREADLPEIERLLASNPALINERGPVGECLIHMCYLYNSPAHLTVARYLMDHHPHCVQFVYEGTEYKGENILHIAIINKDIEAVAEIIRRESSLMNGRAVGDFFKIGSACYYGETPLAFALCTNQLNIAKLLMDHGADLNSVDSNGNTILHLLVIHELPDLYTAFKEEWARRTEEFERSLTPAERLSYKPPKPLWHRENNDGFTPFTLTAALGNLSMFAFLLEERKQVQWRYGPVSCFLYPLRELDSRLSSAESSDNRIGALELIMKNAHTALLMHPRVLSLIAQKWDRFASRIFFQRFIGVLLYMCLFTFTVIIRQSVKKIAAVEQGEAERELERLKGLAAGHCDFAILGDLQTCNASVPLHSSSSIDSPESAILLELYRSSFFYWHYLHPFLYRFFEVFITIGALWKLRKEIGEMLENGVASYFSASGSASLENLSSLIYCCSTLLVGVCFFLGSPLESIFLSLACSSGWFYLFFFLLGFKMTGPFVVMIFEMLVNDVLRFCLIYLVFLFGFGEAFYVLFDTNGFSGFLVSIRACFSAMLGDFDFDLFGSARHPMLSYGLLIVYVLTVTILLLNLLIAMMGNSFAKISESAEMHWQLERGRIIFAIESEMSTEERMDPANKYWTNVEGERYLQVLEVNEMHFKQPKPAATT